MAAIPTNDPKGTSAQKQALLAAITYDEPISSVGAAITGDVVRRVSAGVWTPASADTAANCAGNLGIYTGSAVVPILGNIARLNFTGAAPTLNVPCYLSTVAGKATSTVPSPLAITLYLGTPYVDLTISTNYAAMVGNAIITQTAPSLALQLLAKAAQDCGGSPADYDWFHDPLNTMSATTNAPVWGSLTSGTAVSYVTPPKFAFHSTAGSGFAFSQTVTWTQASTAANRALICARVESTHKGEWLMWLSGTPCVGVGMWNNAGGGSAVNANNFCCIHGFTPTWHSVPTAGQVVDLGVAWDTNSHWLSIELMGDGTSRVSVDWGPWTVISDTAGAGGFSVNWGHFFDPAGTTETLRFDDIFYAIKVR